MDYSLLLVIETLTDRTPVETQRFDTVHMEETGSILSSQPLVPNYESSINVHQDDYTPVPAVRKGSRNVFETVNKSIRITHKNTSSPRFRDSTHDIGEFQSTS